MILWIIVWNRTAPQANQSWIQTTYFNLLLKRSQFFQFIPEKEPNRNFLGKEGFEIDACWCPVQSYDKKQQQTIKIVKA